MVRAHDGFRMALSFDFVEVEKDQDVIKVYKYKNGEKEIVDQVDAAKEIVVDSNRVMVVFRSDCSVNRKGFQATIRAVRRVGNKATSPASKNYKAVVSTEESFETTTSEKTTTQVATTQRATTQELTPQLFSTQTATTQNTNYTTAISQIVKKGNTITDKKLTKRYEKTISTIQNKKFIP